MTTPLVDAPTDLAGLLGEQARRIPDREFLRFGDGEKFTFAQVDDLSGRVAAVLRNRGIERDSIIAVQARNDWLYPITWLALAKLGAVVVPVNAGYRAADLRHVLTDSGAVLVIAADDLVESVRAVADEVPSVTAVMPASTLRFDAAGTNGPIPPEPVAPDSLLNLQYTSGTTGFPKACMLTHAYWRRLGEIAVEMARFTEKDIALTAQPFTYMDPQWNLVMSLTAGTPLVVLPRFSASSFWPSVAAHRATFLYLIGTMPLMLLRQEPCEAEHMHQVRLVFCSGIVPELHEQFERRWGMPWREAFGMTETGVDLVSPVDDIAGVGTGALGVPVRGKQVRVVDPAGGEVPAGTPGELVVRGEPMMAGYWNLPQETAATIREGWLHTGDLAVVGADGRLRLVGRLKDMIRRGGENIAATEVENVLASHPDVAAIGVIAVPDDVRGEEAAAFVQPTPGAAREPDRLWAFAGAQLAPFKVPRFFVFVDELPVTTSEKVAKAELRRMWPDVASSAFDRRAPRHAYTDLPRGDA